MIWCVLKPTCGAIRDREVRVPHAGNLERRASLLQKRLDTFDTIHCAGNPAQKSRLVSRTRSDLKHSLTTGQPEELERPRMDERLADGLAAPDRERRILVRPVADPAGNECVPRDGADSRKHSLVRDALRPQFVHESAARSA